jgi:tripartite ATP-independent transporter DctP family solute receptor
MALLLWSACQSQAPVRRVKLAHGLPTSHPVHQAMVYMAEQLDSLSGGELQADIYPSEQLGNERQCLELLQIGAIGMTKVSAAVMENFSPKMKVLGLPYLFRDRAHSFSVLDGPIGQELLDGGEQYFLKGLCFYDAGSRSLYATQEINTPADLTGMKIRVMESQTAIQMINQLGGKATPIPFGELYSSLQQGTVEGAENNPPSFYSSRHYEVCKFYTLDEHTMVPDVLVGSTYLWARLTEEQQGWLMAAVRRSVPYQRQLWEEAEAEALRIVQEAGVKVIRPAKAPFAEKVQDIVEGYQDQPEMYQLIQRIQAVK